MKKAIWAGRNRNIAVIIFNVVSSVLNTISLIWLLQKSATFGNCWGSNSSALALFDGLPSGGKQAHMGAQFRTSTYWNFSLQFNISTITDILLALIMIIAQAFAMCCKNKRGCLYYIQKATPWLRIP